MTLHPIEQWQIPAETVRVAQAAFPKGNIYMKMYEQLGQLYLDSDFQAIYRSHCGQLALSPARLALITVMQFAEGLSDRQAAESVRSRIDWKYALGLELTDSGFDHSVLNEWRCRLISRGYETQLLDLILAKLKQQKLLKSRGSCRTDSTHVLAAIRRLNRLELVGETLRYALNELAIVAPEWLKARVNSDWFDRYKVRFEQYRLPQEKAEQELLALTIGADCPVRHLCTTAKTEPRLLKFRPQKQYQALKTARANQTTTEFQRQYAKRAGIEGTISQGCRAFDLRRSRYVGLAKTHLQHIAIATAINLYRLIDWFNQIPKAQSRTTPFFSLSSTATVPPTLSSP